MSERIISLENVKSDARVIGGWEACATMDNWCNQVKKGLGLRNAMQQRLIH